MIAAIYYAISNFNFQYLTKCIPHQGRKDSEAKWKKLSDYSHHTKENSQVQPAFWYLKTTDLCLIHLMSQQQDCRKITTMKQECRKDKEADRVLPFYSSYKNYRIMKQKSKLITNFTSRHHHHSHPRHHQNRPCHLRSHHHHLHRSHHNRHHHQHHNHHADPRSYHGHLLYRSHR